MDDPEEIEDFYKRKIEEIDQQLLDSLKETKKTKGVDHVKVYKTNLKKSIESYKKEFNRFLTNQKRIFEKQRKGKYLPKEEDGSKTSEGKLNMDKPFKVFPLKKTPTLKEKYFLKKDLLKFHFKIRLRNLFHKIVPNWAIVLWFKLKIWFNQLSDFFSFSFRRIWSGTKKDFFEFVNIIGDFLTKLFKKIVFIISLTTKKIKLLFAKRNENKKEKTEDEKIAEKLLSKEKN